MGDGLPDYEAVAKFLTDARLESTALELYCELSQRGVAVRHLEAHFRSDVESVMDLKGGGGGGAAAAAGASGAAAVGDGAGGAPSTAAGPATTPVSPARPAAVAGAVAQQHASGHGDANADDDRRPPLLPLGGAGDVARLRAAGGSLGLRLSSSVVPDAVKLCVVNFSSSTAVVAKIRSQSGALRRLEGLYSQGRRDFHKFALMYFKQQARVGHLQQRVGALCRQRRTLQVCTLCVACVPSTVAVWRV